MGNRQEQNDPQLEAIEESLAEIDHIEELVWALLDDQITPLELEQLEQRLLTDDAARHRYVECIQMHTDLQEHFNPSKLKFKLPSEKSSDKSETKSAPPVNPLADIDLPTTQGHTPAT